MSRPLRIEYPGAWYHAMNPCPLPCRPSFFGSRLATKGREGGVVEEVKRSSQRRNIAIYLTRYLRCDSLKEIGEAFEIGKFSTVSSIIQRVKKEIRKDKNIRKRVEELTARLSKGQRQT